MWLAIILLLASITVILECFLFNHAPHMLKISLQELFSTTTSIQKSILFATLLIYELLDVYALGGVYKQGQKTISQLINNLALVSFRWTIELYIARCIF